MTTTEGSRVIAGCDLAPLDASACERYLAWLHGEEDIAALEEATGLVWLLAHSDDGVTWGRYDAQARAWRLGSQVAPEVSPQIHPVTLQELRLFGEGGEVLIWRTDAGLRGRLLRDRPAVTEGDGAVDPLRPSDESRILRGDRVRELCDYGFTRVGDGSGAEQVLPLHASNEQLQSAQIRFVVRHYFEADAETGAVRIAATRLVGLTPGGEHGT